MKLIYGNTPVKSMNVNYYEKNTNDATMKASDLQVGCYCVCPTMN